jgi:hypothetical protein
MAIDEISDDKYSSVPFSSAHYDEDGKLLSEDRIDNVHLNYDGNKIWTKAIRRHIDQYPRVP